MADSATINTPQGSSVSGTTAAGHSASSTNDTKLSSNNSNSNANSNALAVSGAPTAGSHAPATIPKAVIKNVDMSEEMQQASVDIASEAMAKYSVEKDIAAYVKKTMDAKYGPTWHAVVGKNYGSYVTHETQHFIYFYLGQIAFLLWRA